MVLGERAFIIIGYAVVTVNRMPGSHDSLAVITHDWSELWTVPNRHIRYPNAEGTLSRHSARGPNYGAEVDDFRRLVHRYFHPLKLADEIFKETQWKIRV